jgi:hypothetical protein
MMLFPLLVFDENRFLIFVQLPFKAFSSLQTTSRDGHGKNLLTDFLISVPRTVWSKKRRNTRESELWTAADIDQLAVFLFFGQFYCIDYSQTGVFSGGC